MLNSYVTQTRRLLQLPAAPSTLYTDVDLKSYINTARAQLAGEGECIRALGTQSTVAGTNVYPFSGFNLGVSATTGIGGAIHVRSLAYQIASGQRWITPRGWEWFNFYILNDPVSGQSANWAAPHTWAQYGQGTVPPAGTTIGQGGSFYINVPDDAYVLVGDCVCYPTNVSSPVISYLYTINIPAASSVSSSGGGGGSYSSGGGGGYATIPVNDAHGISGFVTLMADWGKTGAGLASDFNGDGKVDILDFVWLMANWLK